MPPASALESRIRARLAALEPSGLQRELQPPGGIDLSSNDYLNLSTHPALIERAVRAAAEGGIGSTASRLLRGDREVFQNLERRFARFKRAERALYFGSGYLANLSVLSALADSGDLVFSDEFNHASLIDGMRLSKARTVVFPHHDVGVLERLIVQSNAPVKFVVVESLFSMEGDLAPLVDYAALCRSTGAVLVVDEAHAVGVYGASGSGLLEASGVDHADCVSISTAGKALGVAGAFVAGPAWAIEYLVQRARPFVFTTAPPPLCAEAIDAALDVVDREPERRARVLELAACLRRALAARGIPTIESSSQIVPILIGDNDAAVAVARAIQQEGFDVRAIRPPSVRPGTARLRVSMNVGLSEAIVERFVELLAVALKETRACSVAFS